MKNIEYVKLHVLKKKYKKIFARVFVVSICRVYLSRVFVVSICREYLS